MCQPSRSIPSLLGRTGWGENKVEKTLMGQDKDSSIREKERPHMEARETTEDSFSSSHQQAMSSHFPGSRASVHIVVALKGIRNVLRPPPFSLLLLLSRCPVVWNVPLDSWGPLSQLCPLPQILPISSLLLREECWRGSLDAAEHCSAVAKSECSQPLPGYQHTALWGTLIHRGQLWRK